MIDLDKLAELSNLWSGNPVRTIGPRCLNVRHRGRTCRICIDACPVNAITFSAGSDVDTSPITLDHDSCVRCGVCLHTCPTGVFAQADPPEAKLATLVASTTGQAIELACPRKESSDLSRVPGASVIQTPRCLAALSTPALLDLVATGKNLWLNDSMCHACPIARAHRIIQRTVTTANRWLQVMGHEPAIRCYQTNSDELAAESISRPVIRGDRSVMSRRDFLGSLGRAASETAASVVSSIDLPFPDEEAEQKLTHHIPGQRQHLALSLRRWVTDSSTIVPTTSLPIADVILTDDCTACGLCTRFCPTEAISMVSDAEYYVLNFSAALCLGKDCNLCVIGCPTSAVRFGQDVTADELLRTRPRPVKSGRLAPCPECGAPTAADETNQTPLCYICQAHTDRSELFAGS